MMPLTVLVRCPATRYIMSQYVAVLSKLQARAWLLLTAVTIRACANAAPLPFELRKQSQAAQPVIVDCLLAGTQTHGGALYVPNVPLVALSWENDFAAQGWGIVNLPRGMRGMLAYAAVTMHTNISNHYTVHFDKSVRRHWAAWLREQGIPFDSRLLGAVVNAFFKGLRQFDTSPVIAEMAPALMARVRCRLVEERARLGLAPDEQWSMKWAEENLELGIRFRLHILAERDVRNAALRAAEDDGDDADNASDDGDGIETPFQKGETVVPLATAGAIFVTCGVMEAKFLGAAALLRFNVREPLTLRRLIDDVDAAIAHGAPVTALRGPGRKLWHFMFNKKKLKNVRRCKDFVLGPTIITNGVTIGVRHTTKNLAHPAGVPDLTNNKRKAARGDAQVRIRFSSAGVALRPAAPRRYAGLPHPRPVGRHRGADRGRGGSRPGRGGGEASSSDGDDEGCSGGGASQRGGRRQSGVTRQRAASLAPSASLGPGEAFRDVLQQPTRAARNFVASASHCNDDDDDGDTGISEGDAPSAGAKRPRSVSATVRAAASAASGSGASRPAVLPKRSRGGASSTGLASLLMGAHLASPSCGNSSLGGIGESALDDDVMGPLPNASLPWQGAAAPAAAPAPDPADMVDAAEGLAHLAPLAESLRSRLQLQSGSASGIGSRLRYSSATSAAGGSSAASAAGGSSAASAAGGSSAVGAARSRGRGRGRGAGRGGGLGRVVPEPAAAAPRVQSASVPAGARMVDEDDDVDWAAAEASGAPAPVLRPPVPDAAYARVLLDARAEARRLGALESAGVGNTAFIAAEAAAAAAAVAAAAAPPIAQPLVPVDGADDALFRDMQRMLPVRWALLALAGRVLRVNDVAWPSVRDGMCPLRASASSAAGPAAQNMDAALAGVAAWWQAHERGFLAAMRAAVGRGNVTDAQLRRLLGVRTHATEYPAFNAAAIPHLALLLESVALLAASHSHEHFSPEEVWLVLNAARHDATLAAVRAELAVRAATAAAGIRSYTPHERSLPTALRVEAALRQVALLGGPLAVPGGAAAAASQAPQAPPREATAVVSSARQPAAVVPGASAAAPRAAQQPAPPAAAPPIAAPPARVASRTARRRAARRVSRLAGVALASRRAAGVAPLGASGGAAVGSAPVSSRPAAALPVAEPAHSTALPSTRPPSRAAAASTAASAGRDLRVLGRRAASAEADAAEAATASLEAMAAANVDFAQRRPARDWVVVGVDPGRVTLLAVAFKGVDGAYVYMTLSRAEYYAAMKVEQNRLRRQRWDALAPGVAAAYADLARHSPKTASLIALRAHIACVARHNDVLWPHALLRRNAQQRFAAFSAKRACVDKFCRRVWLVATQAGQRKMMVSFGGAKFSSTGRGDPGGAPTSWLQTRCRLNWNVDGSTFDVVDENLTSQMCSLTHRQLADVEDRREGHRLEKLARQDSRASRRRARRVQAALAHAPVGGRPPPHPQQQQPQQQRRPHALGQGQRHQLREQERQQQRLLHDQQCKAAAAMLPPIHPHYRALQPAEAGMLLVDLESLRGVVDAGFTQSVVWAPLVAGLVGSAHSTLESLLGGIALMPSWDEHGNHPALGRPAVNAGFGALQTFWATHAPAFVARLRAAADLHQPEPHADTPDQERIAGEDAQDAHALLVFEGHHPELRPFILAVRAFSVRATGAHFPVANIRLAAALAGRVAPDALVTALVADTVVGYVPHPSSRQLILADDAAARLHVLAAGVAAGAGWAQFDLRPLVAAQLAAPAALRAGGAGALGAVAIAANLHAALRALASQPVEGVLLTPDETLRVDQARGPAGHADERLNADARAPLLRSDARRLLPGEDSLCFIHAAALHAQSAPSHPRPCRSLVIVQRHQLFFQTAPAASLRSHCTA